VATFGQRASFLLLPEHVRLPAWLPRALHYVPAAVLTALWAPELLMQKGVLSLALGNERLFAGIVAIAIAWRYRAIFGTIVAGLVALHFFDWMF
jgi:branched-subunit amino acid transport protein